MMASDDDVLGRISALVDEEHDLRRRREVGDVGGTEERQRLQAVEVELDRCWDLLRQRRARKESGQDPDTASPRPPDQVEGYLG